MALPWLKVSDNQRFLIQEGGQPFFWLGCTAWELFHRLNREDARIYLENRAERQFNVIQVVALAELEGLTVDNAYGRRPLNLNAEGKYDPTLPDTEGEYSYWDHVDYIIELAGSLGLYVAFLPTWGDKFNQMWGKGPSIFTADNAREYGQWLGTRYQSHSNIIWILGGDRPLTNFNHFTIIRAMAEGLKQGDHGQHLISFHPFGGNSSSKHVHEEPWLDFNMIQTGHSGESDNCAMVTSDYERLPIKPTLDSEPCYEDHPISFKMENGFYDEKDVRRAAYYAVFSGAFGHTYGHHSIWAMITELRDNFIMTWKEAITRPGAAQMRHIRSLMEANRFLDRVPDQNLVVDNYPGSNYMVATRGNDYAMIYCPSGLQVQVNMGRIKGEQVTAAWFDPRNGSYTAAGVHPNRDTVSFAPPSHGRNDDWVLVMTSQN